jgi:hypothetical protein
VKLGRRTVLLAGAAAGVVALCGGVLALQPTALRTPRRALLALDPVTFSVLAALADRVCPAGGGLPSAWDLEVPEQIDAYLDALHPAARDEVIHLLHLLESGLVGLILDRRPRAFSAATDATRDRVLEAWRDSRIGPRRTGYKVLLALVGSTYWGNPALWRHLGYPGPPRFGP